MNRYYKTVRWNRSSEGFATSKCGRFRIQPLYYGSTRAQAYECYDAETKKRWSADTQKDLKWDCEIIVNQAAT